MNLCIRCGKGKPEQIPGYVTFHVCNTGNEDWKNDPDILKGEVVEPKELRG